MKRLTTLAACLFAATMAHADPYCSDLTNADALPKKIARNAPIYSDTDTGWVFTRDQLKDRYDMKDTARALIGDIVDEFAKRDVALAIAVTPPRPIVAGQAQLDAAMGGDHYDLADAQASFAALIDGLAESGAIAPNLADVALADAAIRNSFHFRRDTHWTTTGAAVSALAVAQATNDRAGGLFPNDGARTITDLSPSGEIEEKGSLAGLVRDICGTEIAAETAESYDLTRASAGGLLGDAPSGPSIALVGSSFSNRYKRDHYRFGDALAWAFDAEVENYSVSGGGPIGAIEAYVLSGALERREHALVVWEIPYTESFNSTSFLRQLLGALRLGDQPEAVQVDTDLSGAKTVVDLTNERGATGLEIRARDASKQTFRLEVAFDNGSTTTINLNRRAAVPADLRSDSLFVSFAHFGDRTPTQIAIEGRKDATAAAINLFNGS